VRRLSPIRVLPVVSTYPDWASGYDFPAGIERPIGDGDEMTNACVWIFDSRFPIRSCRMRNLAAVAGRTLSTVESPVPWAGNPNASLDTPASMESSKILLTEMNLCV
jgi:hypothetical protein